MTARTETIVVTQSGYDERLDTFLRRHFPAVSRAAITRLIEQGEIRVDGRRVKPAHHPRVGERIDVHWPEPKSAEAKPEEIPLEILFEDADLIVINKPAGLVVHPSAGHEEHTIVNALLHHCRGSLSGVGGVARPGIVHRLDKDTSGCLVAAKNDETHLALAEQFAGREVKKLYLALLCGRLTRDRGEIRAAIGRHATHRKRMAVADEGEGREARTSYRVLERFGAGTLVEAELHTGRTHQIRVHFHHIGFPLLGDEMYGKRANRRILEETGYEAPRQMLHAWKLGFRHPKSGRRVAFEAPVPEDFQRAAAALRAVGDRLG